MAWLEKLKEVVRYAPAIWAAIKIIWSLYRAKVRADGYKEALKDEQAKRVKVEAELALRERLGGTDDERMARLRREAKERRGKD